MQGRTSHGSNLAQKRANRVFTHREAGLRRSSHRCARHPIYPHPVETQLLGVLRIRILHSLPVAGREARCDCVKSA